MKHALVVTSISPPNGILKALADGAQKAGWPFYLIGDAICPVGWTQQFEATGTRAYDISAQINTRLKSANALPLSNYSRKNLGYLLAMRDRAEVIVETDDDNRPLEGFWAERRVFNDSRVVNSRGAWRNPLSYLKYNSMDVWPRGYPLDLAVELLTDDDITSETFAVACPIQQRIIDGDTDVDAIQRLTNRFNHEFLEDLMALRNSWCPFNSQNTTWFKAAFPLMYIPSFCKNAYRMDDIWRSFIAQRIAFENGWGILWGGVTVVQERNPHDLMKDFEQEIPGYLYNRKIVEMLKDLSIEPGTDALTLLRNMDLCYRAMIDAWRYRDSGTRPPASLV